jgi:hypothetical protein
MKKRFTRLGVFAAVLALPLTAALAVPMASASAQPVGATVAANGVSYGNISGNFDVPAGVTAYLFGEVTADVSVEGNLYVFGGRVDRNVAVNGGSFEAANQGVYISGNLSITNSAGNPNQGGNGFWNDEGTSTIGGNFSYTYNSGYLYAGYGATTVHGNFTYANNTGSSYLGSLVVNGSQTIS